eukprot:CAMPEP_0119337066 /NCGR_PEP_ID=MMETSP1333-20130426/93203_1 /TAXON_ID=418940 /ORGANISM="Scyphosphaera apsteinii, Strain RCC1455" /LENGTH=327 /DNA_ID=CAMNT_0007348031 /DNA_START=335 /DNA_END=1318 /DNA_ORIENTATION=-
MPVYALISGYLSKGTVTPIRARRTLQGLVLPWFLCDILRKSRSWVKHRHVKVPFDLLGGFWYLGSLVLWRLSVPMLQVVRWPIAVGGSFVLCLTWPYILEPSGATYIDRAFEFLPFFVCGLNTPRRLLEQLQHRSAVRVAARLLLLFSAAAWVTFAPWTSHIDLRRRYNNEHTFQIKLAMLLGECTWAAAACAAMPHAEHFFTANGARSLYAYVLHSILLLIIHLDFGVCLSAEWWLWALAAPVTLLATYLFTSRAAVTIFGVFVEPRWVGCIFDEELKARRTASVNGDAAASNSSHLRTNTLGGDAVPACSANKAPPVLGGLAGLL